MLNNIQEQLVSPWTRTQWFFPSSPARLLAKQVYRPASSTFKETISISLSGSCMTMLYLKIYTQLKWRLRFKKSGYVFCLFFNRSDCLEKVLATYIVLNKVLPLKLPISGEHVLAQSVIYTWTLLILIKFPSCWTISDLSMGRPSLSQLRVGGGTPTAEHSSSSGLLTAMVSSSGELELTIFGGSALENKMC